MSVTSFFKSQSAVAFVLLLNLMLSNKNKWNVQPELIFVINEYISLYNTAFYTHKTQVHGLR
jgi:hypothetical protein